MSNSVWITFDAADTAARRVRLQIAVATFMIAVAEHTTSDDFSLDLSDDNGNDQVSLMQTTQLSGNALRFH